MKFLNLILILLIIPSLLTAQYPPDAIWMNAKNDVPGDPLPPEHRILVKSTFHRFGSTKIDFDSLIIKVRAIFGMTSFNDLSGDLLLYSNGYIIGNRYGDNIAGGGENLYNITDKKSKDWDLLRTYSGIYDPQTMMILPDPEDSLLFHLLHLRMFIDNNSNYILTSDLNHSIISMHDTERRGVMIQMPTNIKEESMWMSNLTAQRHADGKSWWIICRSRENEDFLIFILDSEGIKYSHRSRAYRPYIKDGRAIFSPDGKYLAVITSTTANRKLEVILYRFYDVSGELYFDKIISTDWEEYIAPGLAFSPNSQFLYFTTELHLFQIDIVEDIPQISLIDVVEAYKHKSIVGNLPMFDCKLSPDCRILTQGGLSWRHSIENPNEVGFASISNQRVMYNSSLYVHYLPNTPHFRGGDDMESWCDSYGYKDSGNPRLRVDSEIVRPHYTFEAWEANLIESTQNQFHEYFDTGRSETQIIELKKE